MKKVIEIYNSKGQFCCVERSLQKLYLLLEIFCGAAQAENCCQWVKSANYGDTYKSTCFELQVKCY